MPVNLRCMSTYTLTNQNTCQLPEFQAWTDVYGMITNNDQGSSTDNGNLFTSHYVYGLSATNRITDIEKQRILSVYRANFSQPGLLCRTPVFPGDRQAQDDMYGLMGAEAQLSPSNRAMTKAIYEYGKISAKGIDSTEPFPKPQTYAFWAIKILTLGRCRWVWNNIEPGKFDETSWLGRFPALVATMQMSLQERVNPFNWLVWAGASLYSSWFGNSSDNNGDCLFLQSAIAVKGYGPLTNFVCDQVHTGIKHKYGGVGGLMADYFQNPAHPLVALLNSLD